MVDRGVLQAKIAFAQVRVRELKAKRKAAPAGQFIGNMDVQAIILHHFQVVVQSCCDMASHIVADRELGIPGTQAELFEILAQGKIVPRTLAQRMGMHVGLRNLIVHAYDTLDYRDIYETLPRRIRDITRYLRTIATYAKL